MNLLRLRRTQRAAIVLVAAGLLVAGLRRHATTVHRPAPALPTRVLQGAPVTVASLRGHPTALIFWASWCTGCHVEGAAVERFARSAAGRGRVIGVDDSDGGNWKAFVHTYGWSFPILSDPGGTTLSTYGLTVGLPATVILDARGRVASVRYGAETVAMLRNALAAA